MASSDAGGNSPRPTLEPGAGTPRNRVAFAEALPARTGADTGRHARTQRAAPLREIFQQAAAIHDPKVEHAQRRAKVSEPV